jgi:hypothetical protein
MNNTPDSMTPPSISDQNAPRRPRRLTVDLAPDAADQLQHLLGTRSLSITQAVRQALSLLTLCDEQKYDLILRDKRGVDPDQRIVLVR